MNVKLAPDNVLLNEVVVKPQKEKYSRKNNPAVEFMKLMCLPAFLPRPCNAAVVAAAPRTVYGRTRRPGVRSTFAAEAKPGFWLCRLGVGLLLLYHIRQRIDKAQKKPVSSGFGLGGRFFQSY